MAARTRAGGRIRSRRALGSDRRADGPATRLRARQRLPPDRRHRLPRRLAPAARDDGAHGGGACRTRSRDGDALEGRREARLQVRSRRNDRRILGSEGVRRDPKTIGRYTTIQVPGGTQALARIEIVEVSLDGGEPVAVKRPSLLGAILIKARVVKVRREKLESDRQPDSPARLRRGPSRPLRGIEEDREELAARDRGPARIRDRRLAGRALHARPARRGRSFVPPDPRVTLAADSARRRGSRC